MMIKTIAKLTIKIKRENIYKEKITFQVILLLKVEIILIHRE